MVRIFSHWLPAHRLVQLLLDLLLIAMFMVLTMAWLGRLDLGGMTLALPYALLFVLGMLLVNSPCGVFRRAADCSLLRRSAFVVLCALLVLLVTYAMRNFVPPAALWRVEVGLAVLLAVALMSALRRYALRAGVGLLLARRVMVLGTGTEAAAVERSLAGAGRHVRFVGFYPARAGDAARVAPYRVLANGASLAQEARRLRADEIVVAARKPAVDAALARDLLDCKLAGVRVLELSTYFERALGQVRLDTLRASWLIFGEGFRHDLLRKATKRLFDVVVAALLLGACWLLMLLSAILIVVESGFPVFYRQERVGQGGRLFRVIKFRSMRSDAEQDGKPRWAARNDARVTRVGRVLRRWRIDELPQLWNVLTGDMSLCGPRPERPFFVAQLTREIPFYGARHSVKPGVTGWAQVRYGYGESVADAAQKLQYDLYYVKNHTLFLDLVVLSKTVGVVLTGNGAR